MTCTALLLAASLAWGAPPASADTPTVTFAAGARIGPSRRERTLAMRRALKVDEATREAKRYESQRRRLNRAAEAFWKLGRPSNAVTRVNVDFRTGDVLVEWQDGSKVLRRFDRNAAKKDAKRVKARRMREESKWRYDYDHGVWTNAAGWYCAIGGQRPDSLLGDGCGATKED